MAVLDTIKKGYLTIKTATGYIKLLPKTLASLVSFTKEDGTTTDLQTEVTQINSNLGQYFYDGAVKRKIEVGTVNINVPANSGFNEITYYFRTAFAAKPYVVPSVRAYADATKLSIIIKDISSTNVTFRIGNAASTAISVNVQCFVIGAVN